MLVVVVTVVPPLTIEVWPQFKYHAFHIAIICHQSSAPPPLPLEHAFISPYVAMASILFGTTHGLYQPPAKAFLAGESSHGWPKGAECNTVPQQHILPPLWCNEPGCITFSIDFFWT